MDLIGEISSLKWGLSKQEYRNVFSNKQWQPDHPTQNAVGFYDTIQSRTVFVVAYFLTDNQDKLAKIIINFEGIETDTQRKYIFEDQIKYLTEKYGKPIRSITTPEKSTVMPECCLSERIMWKTNDTIIDASLTLSKHNSLNPFLGITFYDKQNDPLMKGFVNWVDSDYNQADNRTTPFKPLPEDQINEIKKKIKDCSNLEINQNKKDWDQFKSSFLIIFFLAVLIPDFTTRFINNSNTLVEPSFSLMHSLVTIFLSISVIVITLSLIILIGRYTYKITNRKHFMLLGLCGFSYLLSVLAFFVLWRLKSERLKEIKSEVNESV